LRDVRFGRVPVADEAVFFARGGDLRRVAGSVTSDEFSSPVVAGDEAPFSSLAVAVDETPFSPVGCAPSDGAGADVSGVRSSVSGEAAARSMETTEGEDMRKVPRRKNIAESSGANRVWARRSARARMIRDAPDSNMIRERRPDRAASIIIRDDK
jgi:hypothetical protein